MVRELDAIPDDRAAMLFGLGCLRGIIKLAIAARAAMIWTAARRLLSPLPARRSEARTTSISAHPRTFGLLCGALAVVTGCGYMLAAGAPRRYVLVNLSALVLGAIAWAALRRAAGSRFVSSSRLIVALALVLLLTAVFGAGIEGAARWVTIGPISLQVSLVILPLMTVLYARRPDVTSTAAMIIAAFALAVQPDRAMAGVLTSGLLGVVIARRDAHSIASGAAAACAFGWSLLTPDRPALAPFVDKVLYTAFDLHPLAGAAVLSGAAALILPAVAGLRQASDRGVLLAFGGGWSGVVLASALGNYPTPLVGYGASAVLGYFLSVSLLPSALRGGIPRSVDASRTTQNQRCDEEGSQPRLVVGYRKACQRVASFGAFGMRALRPTA
jgi:hypothetical protein